VVQDGFVPPSEPRAYVPNELLSRLVGFRLFSVKFVMDYVQLRFDGPTEDMPVLNCDVLPSVEREGHIWRDGDVGCADVLRGLISGTVLSTTEETGCGLRLEFSRGIVTLNPIQEELVGPEIASLSGFGDRQWMCWRPGEEPFEDLA
jgi:hypothetical protein